MIFFWLFYRGFFKTYMMRLRYTAQLVAEGAEIILLMTSYIFLNWFWGLTILCKSLLKS